ncbi:hypothetical protein ONE63_000335 [Megalurothrips usitatus]|uniref:Uncharacterized protein n=1 Tax=Megalurothrips usitatus TaxID=439358 RepID=A0AAV7Y0L2_9NEOP|nr:hypothetical protein ONE63_000335 [Megalurothrips usitatus]
MLLARVAVLALLVACACLARAADDGVPDIDNNEVLPENDVSTAAVSSAAGAVVRARVDEVAADAPVTSPPPPSSTAAPETTPTPTAGPDADAKDAPTTAAPARPQGTLSRFLSDIIQIPIAVLRSVGSLLSNTFSGHRASTANASESAPSASAA